MAAQAVAATSGSLPSADPPASGEISDTHVDSGSGDYFPDAPAPNAPRADPYALIAQLEADLRDCRTKNEQLEDQVKFAQGQRDIVMKEMAQVSASREELLGSAWESLALAFQHGLDVPADWEDAYLDDGLVKGSLMLPEAADKERAGDAAKLRVLLERAEEEREAAVGAKYVAEDHLKRAQSELAQLRGTATQVDDADTDDGAATRSQSRRFTAEESKRMELSYTNMIKDLMRQLDDKNSTIEAREDELAHAKFRLARAVEKEQACREELSSMATANLHLESMIRELKASVESQAHRRPLLRGLLASSPAERTITPAGISSSSELSSDEHAITAATRDAGQKPMMIHGTGSRRTASSAATAAAVATSLAGSSIRPSLADSVPAIPHDRTMDSPGHASFEHRREVRFESPSSDQDTASSTVVVVAAGDTVTSDAGDPSAPDTPSRPETRHLDSAAAETPQSSLSSSTLTDDDVRRAAEAAIAVSSGAVGGVVRHSPSGLRRTPSGSVSPIGAAARRPATQTQPSPIAVRVGNWVSRLTGRSRQSPATGSATDTSVPETK